MRFTVLDAQAALLVLLRTALPDIAVQGGLPVDKDAIPAADRVYVLDDPLNLARHQITEQGARRDLYDLELLVECQDTGQTDKEPVRTRLWDLLATVDDAIEANDTLNSTVGSSTLTTVPLVRTAPTAEGWLATARCRVTVASLVV